MSNFTKTFEESFQKQFEEQKAAIKKPNLAVVGGTGVGKSSLINRIFGNSAAKAGAGIPVTKGMNKIRQRTQAEVRRQCFMIQKDMRQRVQMNKIIQILSKT